jgi:hypothetical protein
MPHQCIRCGKEYPDGSEALLSGCSCGAKFFFFFREKMPEGIKINNEQRAQVLENVQEIIKEQDKIHRGDLLGGEAPYGAQVQCHQRDKINAPVQAQPSSKEEAVIIDLESIKATKPGKYVIDLAKLFARNPVIYKTGDGKYTIDIDSTFKLMKKR